MSNIKEALSALTETFVDGVMAALEEHNKERMAGILAAIGAESGEAPARRPGRPAKAASATRGPKAKAASKKPAKGGRMARRSPEQIAASVAKVASLLRRFPAGLRAENIRAHTGLDQKELPKVLKQGVEDGAFHIASGQKRATTYAAGGKRKASGGSPRKAVKAKASKKPAKASKKPAKAKASGKKAPKAKKASAKPKAKKVASKDANGVAAAATAA
jgi:hypothetical protein